MEPWRRPLSLIHYSAVFATLPGFLIAQTVPPPASVSVKLDVPAALKNGIFSQDRYLTVPPGFRPALFASVPGARFLAVAPNGDVLVSNPGEGRVILLRPDPSGGLPRRNDFVSGLRLPHGIVFHTINNTTYVYISESNQIDRYIYVPGDTVAHDRQVVVTGLPDGSLPELHGSYGHELKNIALDADHKLYVSIGSSCNVCTSDTVSNPVRGAIYQYNADGTGGRLFARGLRNAEGLDTLPGTRTLWAAVNNRAGRHRQLRQRDPVLRG
jgi:glucose/arabinose dehydrogenase